MVAFIDNSIVTRLHRSKVVIKRHVFASDAAPFALRLGFDEHLDGLFFDIDEVYITLELVDNNKGEFFKVEKGNDDGTLHSKTHCLNHFHNFPVLND